MIAWVCGACGATRIGTPGWSSGQVALVCTCGETMRMASCVPEVRAAANGGMYVPSVALENNTDEPVVVRLTTTPRERPSRRPRPRTAVVEEPAGVRQLALGGLKK